MIITKIIINYIYRTWKNSISNWQGGVIFSPWWTLVLLTFKDKNNIYFTYAIYLYNSLHLLFFSSNQEYTKELYKLEPYCLSGVDHMPPRLYHYYKFSQYYVETKSNPYCHYGYQELFIDYIFWQFVKLLNHV